MINIFGFCVFYVALTICNGFDWKGLNLPDEHIPYYFTNNPDELLKIKKCWGYEDNCPVKQRMGMPTCPGESRGWVKTNNKAEQLDIFWKQGDFGYADSSLECVRHTRYCKATNLYMDFTNARFNQGNDRYAELEHYTSLPFRPIEDNKCDIVIEKPTFLIKLDADVNIIMWDTSPLIYRDLFEITWKAFSDYPVKRLQDYDGQKVCFKQAVFPLLARMRYGMFYNMPMIPGCEKCSLFRAFNQHITHRVIKLELPFYLDQLNTEKSSMKMRNTPFIDQMKVSHNSDIFIGIHGAGLTHMLFQPDWAVVMEIYNCEDEGCYRDLAKLRGIKYMTWENKKKLHQQDEGHHPTLGAHAKFTNYGFDVEEFLRLVSKAADHCETPPSISSSKK
ncbi:hypothetical protein KUTeg_020142 [Tegillarca granosa]|uniref:EGF domain-specific O-linked N-acetylglucosamine transferase n=1 Tax=Tegillarca granosa TaxID=220873 RepID=A0ABQ9ECG9_TEGGR|nr:hypothetical protein KUTeg_020142 [Tegillarca granosa]